MNATRASAFAMILGAALTATVFTAGPIADYNDGTNADPAWRAMLPRAQSSLPPTVAIAPAVGWPAGKTPLAASGLEITRQQARPRVYVLPNGDDAGGRDQRTSKTDGANGLRMGVVEQIDGARPVQPCQR
jgi:hypothetical protein